LSCLSNTFDKLNYNTHTNIANMNFKEITELIKLVDKSSLAEIEIKLEGVQVKIRNEKYFKNSSSVPMQMIAPMAAPIASAPAVSVASAPVAASAPATKEEKSEAPTAANLLEVRSPMVGTFYRSSGPDKPSFVQVGDSIQIGSPVCIIEAMKLFNEIESEVSGKIVKVMVEDATPVEYDQVLFLVEA
jgi:acetyl-CoA carboxylase biotin carboxyl carrier protein